MEGYRISPYHYVQGCITRAVAARAVGQGGDFAEARGFAASLVHRAMCRGATYARMAYPTFKIDPLG